MVRRRRATRREAVAFVAVAARPVRERSDETDEAEQHDDGSGHYDGCVHAPTFFGRLIANALLNGRCGLCGMRSVFLSASFM
jgi:hypothetical protein